VSEEEVKLEVHSTTVLLEHGHKYINVLKAGNPFTDCNRYKLHRRTMCH
jgi:hypothetical protein